MTEQICKHCKHWEYEYTLYVRDGSVGVCTNDSKYNSVSFGEVEPNTLFNSANLPDDWYCSIETDEDDHCKYWEANDGGSIREES